MKYVLVFLIALVLVDCIPNRHSFTKEQRLKRKKKFKEEMVQCLLKESISEQLKTKIEEYKEDENKKSSFLFQSGISESDKLAIRKCRRQTIMDVRKTFGGRFHHVFNRTNPHYHEHFHHKNLTLEDKHEENNTDSHPYHSGPHHSHKHEFNSNEHPHPSCSDHPKMSHLNHEHPHPSGSEHHKMNHFKHEHPHPSGSQEIPHSSNSTQQ